MTTDDTTTILTIHSSGRVAGSVSRRLADRLAARLAAGHPEARVIERDVAAGVEFVDEAWIGANFTPAAERDAAQAARLAGSDALVAEVMAADTLVIGVPIYNFGVPAALKAWVDQIARAGLTFTFRDGGPVGLVTGKKAYLVVASGGTRIDSEIDFATGYMRQALRFIGIEDVTVIPADGLMGDAARLDAAEAMVEAA